MWIDVLIVVASGTVLATIVVVAVLRGRYRCPYPTWKEMTKRKGFGSSFTDSGSGS